MRPVLADAGETAQFLATKNMVLNAEGRERFLDWLYADLAAALARLRRIAEGNYGDDGYAKRFPKFEGTTRATHRSSCLKPGCEKQPAARSVENWQYFFDEMTEHFKDRSAASITPDEAQAWIKSLVGKRSASTVRKNWITASKTIFKWATEHKRLPRNPFADVKVTVPKKHTLRETKAFLPHERRIILQAALTVVDTDSPDNRARRWVPWLCAYTGARPGEITQLRGSDLVERDGIHALRLTPEAGTVKGGKARSVPLHEHLIAQGFVEFARKLGPSPLFYRVAKKTDTGPATRGEERRHALHRHANVLQVGFAV